MNLINKKGLVIRHLPRHDEAVLRRCEAAGVATLHEAWDRQGLMGPAIRPIQQGVSRAGNAVTVLVTPGDNWMFHVAVEQCHAGDIPDLAVRRWLLRRSTGDVSTIARRGRAGGRYRHS